MARPVFVFDGSPPLLKRETLFRRHQQRDMAQHRVQQLARQILLNQLKFCAMKNIKQLVQEERIDIQEAILQSIDIQKSNLDQIMDREGPSLLNELDQSQYKEKQGEPIQDSLLTETEEIEAVPLIYNVDTSVSYEEEEMVAGEYWSKLRQNPFHIRQLRNLDPEDGVLQDFAHHHQLQILYQMLKSQSGSVADTLATIDRRLSASDFSSLQMDQLVQRGKITKRVEQVQVSLDQEIYRPLASDPRTGYKFFKAKDEPMKSLIESQRHIPTQVVSITANRRTSISPIKEVAYETRTSRPIVKHEGQCNLLVPMVREPKSNVFESLLAEKSEQLFIPLASQREFEEIEISIDNHGQKAKEEQGSHQAEFVDIEFGNETWFSKSALLNLESSIDSAQVDCTAEVFNFKEVIPLDSVEKVDFVQDSEGISDVTHLQLRFEKGSEVTSIDYSEKMCTDTSTIDSFPSFFREKQEDPWLQSILTTDSIDVQVIHQDSCTIFDQPCHIPSHFNFKEDNVKMTSIINQQNVVADQEQSISSSSIVDSLKNHSDSTDDSVDLLEERKENMVDQSPRINHRMRDNNCDQIPYLVNQDIVHVHAEDDEKAAKDRMFNLKRQKASTIVNSLPEREIQSSPTLILRQRDKTERMKLSQSPPTVSPNIKKVSIYPDKESCWEALSNLETELEAETLRLEDEKCIQEYQATMLSNESIEQVKALLDMFGLPYIQSPTEADSQCAALTLLGLVDGIITEDSDILVFGGTPVFRNVFKRDKNVAQYDMNYIEEKLGLEQAEIVFLALLLGGDYDDGIKGIGPQTAMDIVKVFPGKEGPYRFKKWIDIFQRQAHNDNHDKDTDASSMASHDHDCCEIQEPNSPPDDLFIKRHRHLFKTVQIPKHFPNPSVIDAYCNPQVNRSPKSFFWRMPDFTALNQFAKVIFGWDMERIDISLKPVVQMYIMTLQEKQPIIESFFFQDERVRTKNKSKRTSSDNSIDHDPNKVKHLGQY